DRFPLPREVLRYFVGRKPLFLAQLGSSRFTNIATWLLPTVKHVATATSGLSNSNALPSPKPSWPVSSVVTRGIPQRVRARGEEYQRSEGKEPKVSGPWQKSRAG